jgi:two-component system OmpR family sensor kinase
MHNLLILTSRTKITLAFIGLVSLLIFVSSYLLFKVAEDTWQNKKMQLMRDSMVGMTMQSDIKSKFTNYRILSDSGVILEQKWLFESRSEVPVDTIFSEGDRYYIVYQDRVEEGPRIWIGEDITDVVGAQYEQARIFVWTSGFTLLLITLIGFSFTYLAFRPIRSLGHIAEAYDRHDLPDMSVHVRGADNDEIVLLARSMERLFLRIEHQTRSLENFSDHIAHEIKNRLFEIASSLEVGSITDPKKAIAGTLPLIRELSAMSDSLLMLHAGTDALHKVPTTIRTLIEHSLGESKDRLKIKGEINVQWNVDPHLFGVAIFNIVGNALKFSTTPVNITLSNDRIEVQDFGVGIAPEDIDHVFDRLYKGDTARTYNTGYGLGLAITKKIVEAHGESISIESTLGSGTTITIIKGS